MKEKTFSRILEINSEEDMMKFNKFEFKNPHKLRFSVLYASAKGRAKSSNYTSALEAFRSWCKKPVIAGTLPMITVRTHYGDFEGSAPLDFDIRSIDKHAPFQTVFQTVLAYQKFLDKVTDYVAFLEESHPEVL